MLCCSELEVFLYSLDLSVSVSFTYVLSDELQIFAFSICRCPVYLSFYFSSLRLHSLSHCNSIVAFTEIYGICAIASGCNQNPNLVYVI